MSVNVYEESRPVVTLKCVRGDHDACSLVDNPACLCTHHTAQEHELAKAARDPRGKLVIRSKSEKIPPSLHP